MSSPIYTGEVPWLTTEQMREVDRAMMEDYKIELMPMKEQDDDSDGPPDRRA